MRNVIKHYFNMDDIQRTFSFLRPFIWKRRQAYFVMLALLLTDIFLTIAFAWFFGHLTDAAVRSHLSEIKRLVPIGIILTAVSISTGFLNIYVETITTSGVKKDLKNHLLNHILRLPVGQASKHHSGELLSHFTTDIHSVDGMVGNNLINLIRLPVIYIVVFIYLCQLNLSLSLFSLAVAPVAVGAGIFFGLILRKNSRQMFQLIGKLNTLLNETFQGLHVIRSFTLENLLFKQFKQKNEKLYRLELENAKLQGWFYSGGQLISSAVFLSSLCFGALFVSKNVMTVGALLTFINLVNHLVYPLTGLAGQWAGFQRSVAAVERLLTVLDQPVDSADLPKFIPSFSLSKTIEFQNVSFSYDERTQVFHQFSLTIPAGKVTALVGPSGGGKSTLLNLLQGFYKPQSGRILIGGEPMEAMTLSELRSAMAYVPQETFLFAGSIRDNLLFARPGIREEEMIEASVSANCHGFISSLPEGYDTEIGERGTKLSGGQKQRIAIARALLKDAPILLLDEATSALDSGTENQVKKALNQLMKGRTTLVIAHRLSTIQHADTIIVLDHGEIIQQGSHESLINQPGLYQRLQESGERKGTRYLEREGELILD